MFKKAQRKKVKLRKALEGPSGTGKTYSALKIAKGLCPNGKIAVIDTENGSASLYCHLYDFDVADLGPPFTPERYIELINAAAKDYDVLIIDSITHEWRGKGGCLEIHSSMPGNSFTNWAKVTPRHNAFMSAILNAPCHIIATMRSKETYVLQENSKGKQEPRKVGMEAEQRSGVLYEFTCVLSLDISHQATSTKDRTGLFPVDRYFIPNEATGEALRNWLEQGTEAPAAPTQQPTQQPQAQEPKQQPKPQAQANQPKPVSDAQVKKISTLAGKLNLSREDKISRINAWLSKAVNPQRQIQSTKELNMQEASKLIEQLEAQVPKEKPKEPEMSAMDELPF